MITQAIEPTPQNIMSNDKLNNTQTNDNTNQPIVENTLIDAQSSNSIIDFQNIKQELQPELPREFLALPTNHSSTTSQNQQPIHPQLPPPFIGFSSSYYPPIAIPTTVHIPQPFPCNNQQNPFSQTGFALNPNNAMPLNSQHSSLFNSNIGNNMIYEHAIFSDNKNVINPNDKQIKISDVKIPKIFKDTERHYCKYCNSSFKHSCHLKRHIREQHLTYKPTYDCKVCNKVFYQRSNLKVHLRAHAADKKISHPWICTECVPNKPFTRKSSLKRHLIKKHKKISAQLLSQLDSGEMDSKNNIKVEQDTRLLHLPPNIDTLPPALDGW